MVSGYDNYSCWMGHLLLPIEVSAIEETIPYCDWRGGLASTYHWSTLSQHLFFIIGSSNKSLAIYQPLLPLGILFTHQSMTSKPNGVWKRTEDSLIRNNYQPCKQHQATKRPTSNFPFRIGPKSPHSWYPFSSQSLGSGHMACCSTLLLHVLKTTWNQRLK